MNPYSEGKLHKIGLDLFVKGFGPERLVRAYMALTNTRETDRLILECATLTEMDDEYNDGEFLEEGIYEAVTVKRFSQTDSRMRALARVFAKHLPEGIAPAEAIIGKPRKTGLFANVTAQIPFSDGQTITIVFHSPSGDAKKIGPDDEIIAYRWLLNKRDITLVVSPEGEGEVSLEEVGKRIAQLVMKNSARFQTTQKDVKAQNEQLVILKADAEKLSTENVALMNGLRDQQSAAEITQTKITMTQGLIEKQQGINADLENQLAALQVKAKADEAARAMAAETAAKQAADEAEAAAVIPVVPEVVTPEVTPVAPEELQSKVMDAYAKVKARGKFSDVWISDLQEQAGIEMGTFKAFLLKESREGRAVLSLGDSSLSLSTAANRAAAIVINGDSNLMVRFLESSGNTKPEVVVPEAEAMVGRMWKTQDGINTITGVRADGKLIVQKVRKDGSKLESYYPIDNMEPQIAADESWAKVEDDRLIAVKAAADKAEADKIAYDNDNVGGFVDGLTAMQKARILTALNKQMRFDGIVMTRRKMVEDAISEGRTVEKHPKWGRILNDVTGGGFLEEKTITKIAMDYAEFLIAKKQPDAVDTEVTQPVTPEPAAEPPAVTVAQDIISGKYDNLPLGDVLKLAGPVMDLDEAMYADLMDQVDAYTTVLTKKAVQAKFAE